MKTQLFVGYRLSSELKLRLREKKVEGLTFAVFKEKEFLGAPLRSNSLSVNEIRDQCSFILDTLQSAYPDYLFQLASITIFPQILLG